MFWFRDRRNELILLKGISGRNQGTNLDEIKSICPYMRLTVWATRMMAGVLNYVQEVLSAIQSFTDLLVQEVLSQHREYVRRQLPECVQLPSSRRRDAFLRRASRKNVGGGHVISLDGILSVSTTNLSLTVTCDCKSDKRV